MRKSVFLHDLEKKYRKVDRDEVRTKAEVAEEMCSDAAGTFSVTYALLFLVVGVTALIGVSYLLMQNDSPAALSEMGFPSLFIGVLLFEILAWLAKGCAAKSVWNLMMKDGYRDLAIFLQIDAASYVIYVVEFVIFFLTSRISDNLAGLTFGGAILLRQVILYVLYKNNLPGTATDRVILIFTNLAIYIAFLALPYLFLS